MWTQFFSILAKSKSIKVGLGAAGGSTLIALIFGLHIDVTEKIEDQERKQKEYVQMVLRPIEIEIMNMKDDTKETKEMVRDIRNHLLNKRNQ